MKHLKPLSSLLLCIIFIGISATVIAQELSSKLDKDDPNQVLAYQGTAVVTQLEIDAAFQRIPEESRLAFIRDGAKVDQLVRGLLEIKMLVNDATANDADQDPMISTQVALTAEKEFARIWTQQVRKNAPAIDFELLAKEDYIANPNDYDKSASIDLTQILLGAKERGPDQAMALAIELKARLNENPAQFQRLLAEYSDDETKVTTFGRLKGVKKGQMVDSFEQAAFALETPGDISEPVSTMYGVHLIRLDAKNSEGIPPFEVVKQEAIDKQVKRYEERYLRQYLSNLFKDPVVFPEGSVEVMAKRHFGENLEKAPVFKESDPE